MYIYICVYTHIDTLIHTYIWTNYNILQIRNRANFWNTPLPFPSRARLSRQDTRPSLHGHSTGSAFTNLGESLTTYSSLATPQSCPKYLGKYLGKTGRYQGHINELTS